MRWFAKKIFDGGGGNRLKNHSKSICYPSNVFKKLKYFTKELAQFLKPRDEEELSRGAILIEFAVCMPILIILLFYINDLVRIKMYYSQTEFVAQQFANIIQNISQKRTDKRIYTSDIRWAFCLANLSMYPGTTMFYKGSGHEFDYSPFFHIYYVKGNADGTASCLWRNRISSYQTSETEPKNLSCSSYKSDHDCSIMRYKTNVTPSQIHPSLKINPGEKKIIIDSLLLFTNTKGGNNTSGKLIPTKQALGLYLASVKYRLNSYLWCFHSVVIFTPKPGLFDDEGPQ